MSEFTHIYKDTITGITKDNMIEKLSLHFSKIAKAIELHNIENVKITTRVENFDDNSDAIIASKILAAYKKTEKKK